MNRVQEPFALYVHIPYCAKKCPYCDFNSYATESQAGSLEEEARYTRALITELQHFAAKESWAGRKISTVFFGGGTPSLFSAGAISEILEAANELFPFVENAEVTLEANPGSLQEELALERLRGFRQGGVNRISLGAQSFSDRKLKLLGRLHSAEDTRRALALVKESGFRNMSLDLIFAVPDETPEEWQHDLDQALSFPLNHISAYGLTIEPGTEFYKREKRGGFFALDEEVQEVLFRQAQSELARAGFCQYEISNYAKAEYECRHNLAYWRGMDYLGIGAGAHSYLGVPRARLAENDFSLYGQRWINLLNPRTYCISVEENGNSVQRSEEIDRDKALLEFFFLGFRTQEGISSERFSGLFKDSLETRYADTLKELKDFEIIEKKENSWALSARGRIMLDSVLERFACS